MGNSKGISHIIKTLREDAHAALRYIAAKRHRGGAKVCKPLMGEELKREKPLCVYKDSF